MEVVWKPVRRCTECAPSGGGAGRLPHSALGAQPGSSSDLRRGARLKRRTTGTPAHGARSGGNAQELFAELTSALSAVAPRVRALAASNLEDTRFVGSKRLPATVGGLLVHVADHTQRHVGQAITTAKVVTERILP